MKLPKIDLSKNGIKRFFLHHVEKVILLLALAGFAVFFWLGFKTDTFADTDPEKLSQKADSARQYMVKPTSWESVDAMRITRDKADGIVKNTKKLELNGYKFRPLLGTPRQSLGLRYDPDIDLIKPYDVEVDVVTAPVVFLREDIGKAYKPDLDGLNPAGSRVEPRDGGRTPKKDDEEPAVGDDVSELYKLVGQGVRTGNTNSQRDASLVKNVVAVRAVIDHKKYWENVESKLKNTFGYFPERDRPSYDLIQVQRKEGDGPWKERTELQKRIENVYSGFAPEVVDPDNYDVALTGKIPFIPLVDYRSLGTHSAVGLRDFDRVAKPETQDEPEVVNADNPKPNSDDLFGGSGDETEQDDQNESEFSGRVRRGSDLTDYKDIDVDAPSGDKKVVRFFDLWDIKPGKTYTYRFRIWVDDPNHEMAKSTVSTTGGNKQGGGDERGNRDPGNIGTIGGGGGGGSAGLADPGASRGGGGPPPGARGGGNGRGGSGGRGGNSDSPPEYKKVEIPDAQKHISVRNRIDNHLADIENDVDGIKEFINDVKERFNGLDLTYSRATDWVEVSVSVPESGKADAFVGEVSARQTRSPRREPVTVADQIARILVSEWSIRFGTLVAQFRDVRKGDWLSFNVNSPLNLFHIVDNEMKKLEPADENSPAYSFRTDQIVVDLMGGEKIDVGRVSPVEYQMPGEMLLMDESGNVIVRNSIDEKREYLLRSQSPDESSEYNASKRKSREQPRGGRGGRGGDDDEGGLGG